MFGSFVGYLTILYELKRLFSVVKHVRTAVCRKMESVEEESVAIGSIVISRCCIEDRNGAPGTQWPVPMSRLEPGILRVKVTA